MTAQPQVVAYRWKVKAKKRADALENVAIRFLESEKVKHLSIRTVQTHDFWLHRFFAWCDERGIASLHDVSRAVVVRYQRHLFYYRKKNGKPLGVASQHAALIALRGFFRYLTKEGFIHANPAADIDLPKVIQKLPKHTLTVSEVEQIFSSIDMSNEMAIRDRAMLEVLYSTGIRRLELCGLRVFDLDDERGVLVVRQGKGRKDRVVPIGDRALAWVRKYLDEERPKVVLEPDDGWLFLTEDGEGLSPNWLSRVVKVHVDRSGITKKGSCHMFRHTMATLLLEGGADIRFIQEMLGHASLDTTQLYTRVSIAQLKAVHAMAHPARLHEEQPRAAPFAFAEEARADLLVALDEEQDDEDKPHLRS